MMGEFRQFVVKLLLGNEMLYQFWQLKADMEYRKSEIEMLFKACHNLNAGLSQSTKVVMELLEKLKELSEHKNGS